MAILPLPWTERDDGPITDVAQVSERWLTDALRRNGHLEQGSVRSVDGHLVRQTARSILYRLVVGFSADAHSTVPSRLLLKFTVPNPSHPEAPVLARHEATFYRALALDMRHLPILRCYDAVCSVPLGRCHFVLDDLTATHVAKREAAENIACLARIHAHWWEHRRFAREIGAGLTDQSIRLLVEQAQGDVAHLATGFRAVVADDDLARYRAILAFYPTLLRDQRRGPRTLVHGDAHCANFLHPLDPSADSVRLIDWEVWRIDAGTNDLAYMIARCQRHWERSFPERDLVQRYHAALEANGVEGYAWDQCWRQYRLAVMRQLLKEISIAVKRGNPEDWMRVEWATAAFDELGCAELL